MGAWLENLGVYPKSSTEQSFMLNQVREGLYKFSLLRCIDQSEKQYILPYIRHHLTIKAASDLVFTKTTKLIFGFLILPFWIPIIFISFGAPFFMNWLTKANFYLLERIGLYIAYLLVFMALDLIVFAPAFVSNRKLKNRRVKKFFERLQYPWFIVSVLILIANLWVNRQFLYLPSNTHPLNQVFLFGSISLISIVLIIICFLVLVCLPFYYYARKRFISDHSDTYLVSEILGMLFLIETHRKRWNNLDFKRRLVNKLEVLSRCIESEIFHDLDKNDLATLVWFKSTKRRISAAIREKKKWILMSKPDTKEYFVEYLKRFFVAVVTASWDDLDQVEPGTQSTKQLFYRLFDYFTVLLQGALPLIFIGLIQISLLAVNEPLSSWLVLGGIIWLALAIISIVDPLYKEKLSALKEIKDLFKS